jgi:hypothetical protein
MGMSFKGELHIFFLKACLFGLGLVAIPIWIVGEIYAGRWHPEDIK